MTGQRQIQEDLRAVMASAEGRRVVYRLLEQAGVYRLSFAGEAPLLTAFNEGMRSVGLSLAAAVTAASPAAYTRMLQENAMGDTND